MNPSLKTLCPVLLLAALALSACGGGGGGGGMTASSQTSGPDDTMGADPETSPPDEPGPGSPSPLTTPSLSGSADVLAGLMESEPGADPGFESDGFAGAISFTYPRVLNVSGWSESGGLYRTDAGLIAFIRTDIEMPDTRRLLDVYPFTTRFDDPDEDDPAHFDSIYVLFDTFREAYGTLNGFDGRKTGLNQYLHQDTLRGTLGDAAGLYRCQNQDGCSVTADNQGEVTSLVGWVFAPLDESGTVQVPDADYLYYGVWADQSAHEGEFVDVESFAGSSLEPSTVDQYENYELNSGGGGTVTYAGGAAGMYVRGDRHGTFTGRARLTLDFSGFTSVSGEITGLSGGASGWTVPLGQVNASAAPFTGETTPGNSWTGQFYGTEAEVLVGEFDAVFDDGRLLGGFGARAQ